MTSNRMESVNFALSAVELLRALKTIYPYSTLSVRSGLSKPVLCRYVKGTNLPSYGTAMSLQKTLGEFFDFKKIVSDKLRFDAEGYIDSTMVSCDATVLTWAGLEVLVKYGSKRFAKVLTAATDGIPLASAAAMRLGIPLVIANRGKEVGIRAFIEESCASSSPPYVTSLYVPKGAISLGERVLIVDNIVRTGGTLRALLNLVKKIKADAPNVYILISVGNEWRDSIAIPPKTRVDVVLPVNALATQLMGRA